MITVRTSDALWELFEATGGIGAYLLYRQCFDGEKEMIGSGIRDLEQGEA